MTNEGLNDTLLLLSEFYQYLNHKGEVQNIDNEAKREIAYEIIAVCESIITLNQ